jgi:AcrR family transcriptional regulator
MGNTNQQGKEKLCKALLVLLETKKLKEITVKDLVAVAGVNRSTYNYHFYSMEDVLEETMAEFSQGLRNSFTLSSSYGHTSKIKGFEVENAIIAYMESRKRDISTLYSAGYGLVFMDRIEKDLESIFRRYSMIFISETGEKEELFEGLAYELRIKEFCYSIIADLQFWMEYKAIISLEEVMTVVRHVKHVHLISARLK